MDFCNNFAAKICHKSNFSEILRKAILLLVLIALFLQLQKDRPVLEEMGRISGN